MQLTRQHTAFCPAVTVEVQVQQQLPGLHDRLPGPQQGVVAPDAGGQEDEAAHDSLSLNGACTVRRVLCKPVHV